MAEHAMLRVVHGRLRDWPGVATEFAPTPIREGLPTHHVSYAMPGGVRVELATAAP